MARTLLPLLALFLLAPALAQKPGEIPGRQVRTLKDFNIELLYSVPLEKQGSWVALCADDKGRLIASDQSGVLYRITPPPVGKQGGTRIETIPANIGAAQGLLWAFDSLYVVVNRGNPKKGDPKAFTSGLYRVTSSKKDDRFDKVELLRKLEGGGGEHGPHAVMLTPDGKNLAVVCGNQSKLARPFSHSRVPEVWGEDHLLKRMPDGNGFMAGVLGPGGAIYQVTPDGKDWELLSVGFRNQYDAAFNRHGELFTYDADMEWDMNAPWYRPTRVNHVTSGSEFGWRNGAGKWPAYYPDSLGAVVNIGPGSPTGVCFGYGAKFPAKYQEAFYICDWSYGKLYAVHLKPHQSSYTAEVEEFVTGTPLPLTDMVINPKDGAMYFAVGGRRAQSGLYRVTYTGKESTAESKSDEAGAKERAVRRSIEAFHKRDDKAVAAVWPHLNSEDRYIRYAARVALEHQDAKTWADKALEEKDASAAINALLGLVRVSASCPQHHPNAKVDEKLKGRIFGRLLDLGAAQLSDELRMDLLRVWQVAMSRMGPPADKVKKKLVEQLDAIYPAKMREMNAEMVQLLVYLEAPKVVEKTLKLMADAPTQEEQMDYARALRVLKTGWTMDQRREFLNFFVRAGGFRGGNSLRGFLRIMKTDAVASMTEAERVALKANIEAQPIEKAPIVGKPRPVVKNYKVSDLVEVVEKGLKTKRDFERGRRYFAEARCFVCHRFDNDGGAAGPDLTGVSGRFSIKDLLESTIEPSKVISDQYAAVEVTTTRGQQIVGRIVNLNNDQLIINTDMGDPNALSKVVRKQIETMVNSKLSMMPTGLIDGFTEEEIVDLMAYLLSRGDRKNKMFQ